MYHNMKLVAMGSERMRRKQARLNKRTMLKPEQRAANNIQAQLRKVRRNGSLGLSVGRLAGRSLVCVLALRSLPVCLDSPTLIDSRRCRTRMLVCALDPRVFVHRRRLGESNLSAASRRRTERATRTYMYVRTYVHGMSGT